MSQGLASSPLDGLTALTYAHYESRPGRLIGADVCCDLVWSGGRLTLTGPLTHGRPSLHMGSEVQLLRIDPVVARQWLGIPLSELTNGVFTLSDIDPAKASALNEAYSRDELGLLVGACDGLADESTERVTTAMQVLRRCGRVDSAALAAGVAPRHLERLFRDHAGMSPKLFARIVRFRRAVGLATSGHLLAEVATSAGYADQAHLCRESVALAGLTPRALLRNVGNVQDVVRGRL